MADASGLAIEVRALTKRFGTVMALDGVDLHVRSATVFGLLGPNGAGKTTLVRILATLLEPTRGRACVLGHDVVTQPLAVRRKIGLAGQFAAVDDELTGRENLEMIARLCRLPAREARRRAGQAIERFGLSDAADRRLSTFSGGMRRRLDLAAGLIGRPPVVLLDEPTVGLDPRSRQALWRIVRELRDEGTTILLTTQYLEEADQLAERIAVIDHGRIVAEGTPSELKTAIGGSVLTVRIHRPSELAVAAEALTQLDGGEAPRLDAAARAVHVSVSNPSVSAEAIRRLDARCVAPAAVELHQPTLDEVFLTLTGRTPEPEAHTSPREHA
ncbi:MAG: ATP-binding cassette domain-containing protein [Solirubrobacterales bacterium]|nr:ATP-binding cassette domain-containing protein [Solirubrobacterales bacterium]